MLERLLEFVALLRKNGVRVSTAEVLDALRAAELVGLAEPAALRGALGATLLKRASDAAVFDELFALYFLRGADFAGPGRAPLVDELRGRGFGEDEIEALLALLADEAARLSATARSSLGLRRDAVEPLVRQAGAAVRFDQMTN